MRENDHEHKSFEAYAELNKLDRSMHPMFLLYLNEDTSKKLDTFKAGYAAGKQLNDLEIMRMGNHIRKLEKIVEAVANIGIDFGFGEYKLEQKYIDKARKYMEVKDGIRSNQKG